MPRRRRSRARAPEPVDPATRELAPWAEPPDDPAPSVRHVQPYEARKAYRCPGCDHEIPPGTGHEVVVPAGDPAARRHWHSGCWHRAGRRGAPA